MIAQQAKAAHTTHERTVSPHMVATTDGVAVATKPMSTRPAQSAGATREMPRRADSGTFEAEYEAKNVEQKRAIESLTNFKKFNPLIFSSEGSDPMIVESWVDSIE